jgi:hypothetical protein
LKSEAMTTLKMVNVLEMPTRVWAAVGEPGPGVVIFDSPLQRLPVQHFTSHATKTPVVLALLQNISPHIMLLLQFFNSCFNMAPV